MMKGGAVVHGFLELEFELLLSLATEGSEDEH